ncbi:MAG: KH domain-containing protein [Clostridia bacterium]|nr:KH domain-containing protein [Clostridia bacterium]MCL6521636.1 KH domain-containing protein [Bacillota bacterium]
MAARESLRQLLELLVESLVEHPEEVRIREEADPDERVVRFRVRLAAGDVGQLIGRQGRVIQAVRTVLRSAAGRAGLRAEVDVEE